MLGSIFDPVDRESDAPAFLIIEEGDVQPAEGEQVGNVLDTFAEKLPEVGQVCKMIGDEVRIKILLLLAEVDEMNVKTLCGKLGMSQTAVSHHLSLLRVSVFLESRRDGKFNFYSITENGKARIAEAAVQLVCLVADETKWKVRRSVGEGVGLDDKTVESNDGRNDTSPRERVAYNGYF